MKMKFLALAAACLVLSLDGVRADEPEQWFGDGYDGVASLTYGVPDSDGLAIDFTCKPPAREVEVTVWLKPQLHPESGKVQIKITTTPSTERLVMNGNLEYIDEIITTTAKARGLLNVSLARMLKQGKTLEVNVGPEKMILPLDGAAAHMKPLVDCAEAVR